MNLFYMQIPEIRLKNIENPRLHYGGISEIRKTLTQCDFFLKILSNFLLVSINIKIERVHILL